MAVNVGTVEVLLQLRDMMAQQAKASATILKQLEATANNTTKATDNLDRSHARTASTLDKFGRQVRTTLVHVAAAGAAYKLLGAAVDSVSKQVEFVRTFEKIENITGVTRQEVDQLRASINELSTATAKGPQELAEGFYSIASAGIKGAQATEILTASARASAVGLGETKDIARSITAAINAYGAENLSAARAADILLAAVREGGAEASEVAGVFGRVVGISAQLGVSFEEVGSFIATFTRLGVGADEAVTALRGSLTAMLTPTRNQEQALKAVGSSMAQLREEVREKGLTAALINLTQAAKGNEDIIGAVIPNVRSLAGVLGVAGGQAAEYAEVTRKVTQSTGDLDEAFKDVSQSASFRWDRLKVQFEQIALQVGNALLPGVLKFGEYLLAIDTETLERVGKNFLLITDLLGKSTQAAINFFDALSNGLAKVRDHLPGLVKFYEVLRDGVSYFNNFLTYSERAEKDIDAMRAASDRAGTALARLASVKRGETVTFTEYQQLKKDVEAATEAITELARRRDALKVGDANIVDKKQLAAARAAVQEQIDVEVLRRDALKETVDVASRFDRITRDASAALRDNAQAAAKIKLPNADAESFAQKLGEVRERLADQLELAKANLLAAQEALKLAGQDARQRINGARGELEILRAQQDRLHNQHAITQAARIELEVQKEIHRLENLKRQLSAEEVAEIRRSVTERIKAKDATEEATVAAKVLNAETKLQTDIWRSAAEAAKRLADEVLNFADDYRQSQLDAVDFTDSLQKQLDALVAGNLQAARAQEIYRQYLAQGVELSAEQAEWWARIANEQERLNYLIGKMAELSKPTWKVYYDAAFDAINAIGDALSDVIYQAAMEGKVSWESIWESLKSSLIRIFADMLADMLRRWIATQLAMRVASQSINAGSSSGNVMGGLLGGGSGGIPMFSTGGTSGLQGFGGATGMEAAGQYAAIAFALYVVYKGFIEDHKRKFAEVTISGGAANVTAAHGKKYLQGVQDAAAALLKSLADWMEQMDVMLTSFATISISQSKHGFGVRSGSTIIGSFKTAEEALDAAAAFMVRFGEFADSVPALVQAAIRGTREMSMEAITSNVQFARELLAQNLSEVERQMTAAIELFVSQVNRSLDLFTGSELITAIDSSIIRFSSSLQQLYDTLTGHESDPREQAERQRQAYNAQRAIMIAQITLLYEEVRARVAALQAHIAYVQRTLGTVGGPAGGGEGRGPGAGDGAGPGGGRAKGGGAYVEPRPDERNPTNNPQLAALLHVLDNLARVLAGLPPEIGEGGVKPGRRDGGGRGRAEGVRDFMDDMRFQLAQAGRSPLQQEIESIRRSFAEQLEAAGKNVKLRQELLALEAQAIEAAKERFQLDVTARFEEMTGQTNAFTELRKRFTQMRKDIADAGFAADKAADMLAKLAAAEEEAVEILSQQIAGDLLGGLAQYIDDEKMRQELLTRQAEIKFHFDMINYRTQFEILKAIGKVGPEVIEAIERAFDWIEDHPPNFGPPAGGDAGGGDGPPTTPGHEGERYGNWVWRNGRWMYSPYGGSGGGGSTPPVDNSYQQALDLLARYQSEGLSRWHRALKELNDDFDMIRRALGNTPAVAQAYADALERLRQEFLEGLREFYEQLTAGPLTGASVNQQYEDARARYLRLLAAVQGGDLSQADALAAAAQQYVQLAGQMFDTSTIGYQQLLQQVREQIAAILGVQVGGTGNVIGGADRFTQGNAQQLAALANINTSAINQVAATTNLASVVDIASRRQEAILHQINSRLMDIETAVRDGNNQSTGTIAVG